MNPAAATRLEKEKHPERFCPHCLWRVTHGGRSDAGINSYPDTPCPKHMQDEIAEMDAQVEQSLEYFDRYIAGDR